MVSAGNSICGSVWMHCRYLQMMGIYEFAIFIAIVNKYFACVTFSLAFLQIFLICLPIAKLLSPLSKYEITVYCLAKNWTQKRGCHKFCPIIIPRSVYKHQKEWHLINGGFEFIEQCTKNPDCFALIAGDIVHFIGRLLVENENYNYDYILRIFRWVHPHSSASFFCRLAWLQRKT